MATQRQSSLPSVVEGSSCREVATIFRRSTTSAVDAGSCHASTTKPGQGSRLALGRESACGKVRQQAQIPAVEVPSEIVRTFLETGRKNVSKSQEEVPKAQQALTEAQRNHAKWVDEVARRNRG